MTGAAGAEGGHAMGRAVVAALVVVSVAFQALLFDRTLVPMDEGHLAAAADWMLDGKALYAEIHTGIFPGIYLITSGLFALFGRDLLVTRLAAVCMNVAIVLALHAIARRTARPPLALLPPFLHLALLALAFPVLSMFNYSTLAVCFGLLALVFLLRYLEGGRDGDGALLGLFVAAAALTKQNFGGLVFVSLWIALVWTQRDSALAGRPHWRALVPIGLAGALPTALVALFFAAQGTLGVLIDATILSLGGSQLQDFDNPIPPILGALPQDVRTLFLYLPPAFFNALVHGEPFLGLETTPLLRSIAIRLSYGLPLAILALSVLLLFRTGRHPAGETRNATRATVLFAVIFWPGIFPSAIWSHLAFVTIPMLLLVGLLVARAERGVETRGVAATRGFRIALGLGCAVVGVAAVDIARDVVRWNPHPLGLERATLRVSERELGLYRGAVEFVDACAGPGEPILAIPDIPAIYFLTDRPSPSRFDLTIPGNVDGPLIAARLESEGVRCVVMNPQMYPEFPPFKALFPVLARAIEERFRGERVIAGGDSKWVGLVRHAPVAAETDRGL